MGGYLQSISLNVKTWCLQSIMFDAMCSTVCLGQYLTQNTVRLDYENCFFGLISLYYIGNLGCLDYEHQKRTDMKRYVRLPVTCLLLLSDFNQNQNRALNFSKTRKQWSPRNSVPWKSLSYVQANRHMDMKASVTFCKQKLARTIRFKSFIFVCNNLILKAITILSYSGNSIEFVIILSQKKKSYLRFNSF